MQIFHLESIFNTSLVKKKILDNNFSLHFSRKVVETCVTYTNEIFVKYFPSFSYLSIKNWNSDRISKIIHHKYNMNSLVATGAQN